MTSKEINKKIKELKDAGQHELAGYLLFSQNTPDDGGNYNVFGTIGWNISNEIPPKIQPFIEVFRLIECPDDLNDLRSIHLRHRFNSQRHYKCFGLKVSKEDFKLLEVNLEKDNEKFAKYIESLDLNYFTI